jgi:hypothetical protein
MELENNAQQLQICFCNRMYVLCILLLGIEGPDKTKAGERAAARLPITEGFTWKRRLSACWIRLPRQHLGSLSRGITLSFSLGAEFPLLQGMVTTFSEYKNTSVWPLRHTIPAYFTSRDSCVFHVSNHLCWWAFVEPIPCPKERPRCSALLPPCRWRCLSFHHS